MPGDPATFLLPVATHVLLASCKAAVAIALLLLCRKWLVAHLSAQLRRGLWLVVIAALLLPVGFEVPVMFRAAPAVQPTVVAAETPAIVAPVSAAPSWPAVASDSFAPRLQTVDPPSQRIPLQSWLALLWAAVAAGLAAVPAWHLYRYRRICLAATAVCGPARQLLLECQAALGLRRAVGLRESTAIASPAVFGWRSPTVLLPPGMRERFDPAQLRHVFLHELAHVQRHDILVNWLMAAAQVLHWFNPLVWYGLRVMRSDMEQASDARVLGQLPAAEHADYGHTLIGVWDAYPGRAPAPGLGVVENQRQLQERIVMIAGFSNRKMRSPVVAVMLMLGLASVAATQPQIAVQVSPASVMSAPGPGSAATPAIRMAQAAQPAPTPAPRSAPPPAPVRGTDGAAPAAQAAAPFVVQLLPPEIAGADETIHASLQRYYLALAAKLRAVPGLTLLMPESAGQDGVTINYRVEFKVTVLGSGRQAVNMGATTLSQRAASRSSATGWMSTGGGTMFSTSEWGPDGWGNGRRPDPERDLDRFVEMLRVRLFPTDAALLQQLHATLRDSRQDSDRRLIALDLLLMPFRAPPPWVEGVPDPAVIRGGMEFAATEANPGRRAAIWGRLGDTRSPELIAPLVQALGAEKDEKARIQLVLNLARNYSAEPAVRAALESVARSGQRELVRRIAQHILRGGAAWSDYVLATLKDTQLTDSQRIEPLSYASASSQDPLGPVVLDDEAIRIVGGMLAGMKSNSDGAGIAFALRGLRSPLAFEVIADILRPAEGEPQLPREIRGAVLTQLSGAVGQDPRARALIEDVAAHDADVWMREAAQSLLDSLARRPSQSGGI